MKKRTLFLALAALISFAACEKDPDPVTPDNPGGNNDNPTEITKNVFSVGEGKTVSMATGNLQYQASTKTWRIAPVAWDACKNDNTNASETYDGWIDCFGWGTSGYLGLHPYTTINYPSSYYVDGDIAGTEFDWGLHNAIVDGDHTDTAGTWRTLTSNEVEYLILTRNASTLNGVENARFANATVYGQTGIILFPDAFVMPEDVPVPDNATINTPASYKINEYSASEWNKMEEAGCVFLPAAGCRNASDNSMIVIDNLGCYWTSTFIGDLNDGLIRAGQLWFNTMITEVSSAGIQHARCVRLAKDIK